MNEKRRRLASSVSSGVAVSLLLVACATARAPHATHSAGSQNESSKLVSPDERTIASINSAILRAVVVLSKFKSTSEEPARGLLETYVVEDVFLLIVKLGDNADSETLCTYSGLRAAAKYWDGKDIKYEENQAVADNVKISLNSLVQTMKKQKPK